MSSYTDLSLKNFRFYYGIPHCHTNFSTGRGTPVEALNYAKKNGLDFMIITDHNSHLKDTINVKNERITKWKALKSIIDKYNKKNDDFVAILGFETRSYPWGDLNIVNTENFFTGVIKDIRILLLWLLLNKDAFIFINHPHSPILTLPNTSVLNHYLNCIEVGNGSSPNKYLRYEKYYVGILDKGFRVSAINGQDNHRINFGDSDNVTGVVCKRLSKPNVLYAFKNRHTYSTESKTLKLLFFCNSTFMGGEITFPPPENLDFLIMCEDVANKIIKIQILTSKGKIIVDSDNLNLPSIKYMYTHKSNKDEKYYFVKVFSENDKLSYSSPVFLNEL